MGISRLQPLWGGGGPLAQMMTASLGMTRAIMSILWQIEVRRTSVRENKLSDRREDWIESLHWMVFEALSDRTSKFCFT